MNDFVSGEKINGLCDLAIYEKWYLDLYPNIIPHCKNLMYVGTINNELIQSSKSFFIKKDWLFFFRDNVLPLIKHPFILICHNDAATVGKCQKILNNPYLIKWYGQNMIPSDKTMGIPVGLQNTAWQGWDYNICHQNYSNKKTNLLYVNFSLNTNPIRNSILNTILQNGFTTNKKQKWADYIKELSTYKFCISPPGFGVDCHRIWESIYVGCIPIVLKNNILYKHFKDLPILFIDDYSIITKDYLENFNISNFFKNTSTEKTKLSYWREEFHRTLH